MVNVRFIPMNIQIVYHQKICHSPQNTPSKKGLPKQRINKETQVLNDALDEMDLTDIFRMFHPNAEEYIFFSNAHETFSRIDHILGHRSNLSKFKKIEIISSIVSNHNTMRLDINYKAKSIRNKHMEIKQHISK